MPDSINCLKHLSVLGCPPAGFGRSSQWTVIPWLVNGDEHEKAYLASATIITRSKSIPRKAAERIKQSGFSIAGTENGLVNKEIVADGVADAAKRMRVSRQSPGILILDGHASHLSRELIAVARKNYLWAMILPSNLSTLLQVGDLGPNARIEQAYKSAYSMSLDQAVRDRTSFDDSHRLIALIDAVKGIEDTDIISSAFAKAGMTS